LAATATGLRKRSLPQQIDRGAACVETGRALLPLDATQRLASAATAAGEPIRTGSLEVVTTVLNDPTDLTQPFIISSSSGRRPAAPAGTPRRVPARVVDLPRRERDRIRDMNSTLLKATGIGTLLQTAMVVIGHFIPALMEAGLFPVGGTLIGLVTGWMAGAGVTAPAGSTALAGGAAAGVAGVLGSLVSTALGDVPLGNVAIAGVSTFVAGAIGAFVRRRRAVPR
jgi:hypothetical protein